MNAPSGENAFYHLVFLEHALLLVKRPGADWRALQDEFADYKASLGPWRLADAVVWLGEEYGEDAGRDSRIAAFGVAKEDVLSI